MKKSKKIRKTYKKPTIKKEQLKLHKAMDILEIGNSNTTPNFGGNSLAVLIS